MIILGVDPGTATTGFRIKMKRKTGAFYFGVVSTVNAEIECV